MRKGPGSGWVQLNPAVWELGEMRIHTSGILATPDKSIVYGNTVGSTLFMFIRLCGGNRKRAVMTWARHLLDAYEGGPANRVRKEN